MASYLDPVPIRLAASAVIQRVVGTGSYGVLVTWASRYPPERLVAHDPDWGRRYAALATALVAGLGEDWVVEHVGSTSVPGLCAKPVIDLAVRVPAPTQLANHHGAFVSLGWTAPGPLGDHSVAYLLDQDGVRQAIAHLINAEAWPDAPVRLFAAWLREHPADAAAYARLKSALVGEGVWGSDYTTAKAAFVADVVRRARAGKAAVLTTPR